MNKLKLIKSHGKEIAIYINTNPDGQLAFVVRAKLPWHREPMVKVMVEITMSEMVVMPLVERKLIHGYGEIMDSSILTYSLEEIIAEKLRAILQFTKKLHEHSWARSRTRDYYDLYKIFLSFYSEINYEVIRNALEKKCTIKSISFSNIEDFFQPITIAEINKTWDIWITPLVVETPEVDMVLSVIREKLRKCYDASIN